MRREVSCYLGFSSTYSRSAELIKTLPPHRIETAATPAFNRTATGRGLTLLAVIFSEHKDGIMLLAQYSRKGKVNRRETVKGAECAIVF